MIIQCTDYWPSDVLKEAGQGRVHDYLLKNVLGIDYNQGRIACGGFSYHKGELKFSSVWLNSNNQIGAESDGDKMLSILERSLVRYCFKQYKLYGKNHTFEAPFFIGASLLDDNPHSCILL